MSLHELYLGHMLLMLVYGKKKGMLAIELFKLEPDFISFEAGVVNNSVDSCMFLSSLESPSAQNLVP